MCPCGILCAVGDAQLVTGVASAPVVNGCEQRGHRLLGGLCQQPWQKATHEETELDSQPGNLLDSKILFLISHLSCVVKVRPVQGFEGH